MRGWQREDLLSFGTRTANWNRSNHDLFAALFLSPRDRHYYCSCASTGICAPASEATVAPSGET